jgi:hypothetical protein
MGRDMKDFPYWQMPKISLLIEKSNKNKTL